MGDSYIKLFRKSLHNDIFNEKPFDRWHAFEYLLLRAQRFPTDVVLNGQVVHLETGQLIESEATLADRWGWSRGKVRRFLQMLDRTGIATSDGTALGTAITIEKYTFYQCGETADGTALGTADGTHKKKDKESKRGAASARKSGGTIEPKSKAYQPYEMADWEKDESYGTEIPEELKKKIGGV